MQMERNPHAKLAPERVDESDSVAVEIDGMSRDVLKSGKRLALI